MSNVSEVHGPSKRIGLRCDPRGVRHGSQTDVPALRRDCGTPTLLSRPSRMMIRSLADTTGWRDPTGVARGIDSPIVPTGRMSGQETGGWPDSFGLLEEEWLNVLDPRCLIVSRTTRQRVYAPHLQGTQLARLLEPRRWIRKALPPIAAPPAQIPDGRNAGPPSHARSPVGSRSAMPFAAVPKAP